MDIRAWEKARTISNEDEEDKSNGEQLIEGNMWVFQCKREKQLGPAQIRKILADFQGDSSIHGYIIAAPVNFSKKSYDAFREEIRKKGITECYLWGKAELEDMLLMPKNDRILFTFFGVSLTVKRRTQTSEVKFKVNNKNKLFRILGDDFNGRKLNRSLLLRDIYDTYYPYMEKHKDFEKHPRWEEVVAHGYHPQGLLVYLHKYYAYFNPDSNEFDFTNKVDMLPKLPNYLDCEQDSYEQQQAIDNFVKHLPRKHQAFLLIEGIAAWKDILVIDDKGDSIYKCPHIFVDTVSRASLVTWQRYIIERGQSRILLEKQFKRKKVFPKNFSPIKKLEPSYSKSIELNNETKRFFEQTFTFEGILFGVDKKYCNLKKGDVIPVSNVLVQGEQLYLEITHKYNTTVKDYLDDIEDPRQRSLIEKQADREVKDDDFLLVLECQRVLKWQLG